MIKTDTLQLSVELLTSRVASKIYQTLIFFHKFSQRRIHLVALVLFYSYQVSADLTNTHLVKNDIMITI